MVSMSSTRFALHSGSSAALEFFNGVLPSAYVGLLVEIDRNLFLGPTVKPVVMSASVRIESGIDAKFSCLVFNGDFGAGGTDIFRPL